VESVGGFKGLLRVSGDWHLRPHTRYAGPTRSGMWRGPTCGVGARKI